MRKLLLLLMLILPIICFSQGQYFFKSGGRIMQDQVVLSPDNVRILLENNENALKLYNAGRNKKTIGNVLFYGGIGSLGIYINDYMKIHSVKETGVSITPLIIGGVMIIAAIPVKIGFSNKIRQAVALMNEQPKNTSSTNFETSFIANANGVGLSLTF